MNSFTCTGESITGIACRTGAVETAFYVVTSRQWAAAAVARCTFVNVWNSSKSL